ncbi:recombination protein RecT [Lachnotalea glycerini]|uniref:Recombination protein RecT n=1 Tax=Lachnotalea glycerini TaxID=1763509 RepID=A0A318EPU6_9FIRM|nr:RecT family recombinase [Lachnotalea glycerini]PXV88393.1 recombination protein RecT [Lachnotalea glycerini]
MANQLTVTNKTIEQLTVQLEEKEKKGLKFPTNYSVQNAMNSAYLMLKEAEDKNHNPLLEVCTQESVIQSLMQMATQGLNPVKKQCYFVAYGKKCTLVPSYFGTLAMLNRVKSLKRQPVANVVRQGDIFEYGYDLENDGEMVIYKHETKLENLNNPIIAAYAIISTDKEKVVEIMSKNEIESAWAQGQSWKSAKKNGYESATHKNFPEEMAKKTVLNRASKRLINATDDSSIMGDDFLQSFNETSDNDKLDIVAENVAVEIEEKANAEVFQEAEAEEPVQEQEVVETEVIQESGDIEPDFMK